MTNEISRRQWLARLGRVPAAGALGLAVLQAQRAESFEEMPLAGRLAGRGAIDPDAVSMEDCCC